MSKLNDNIEKIKSTAKDTVQKVKTSDAVDKVKSSVKEASAKVQESGAVEKIKTAVNDTAQKVMENETVAKAAEKINENQYVGKAKDAVNEVNEKAKKSEHYTLIKAGALVLAVILVFSLLGSVFGGKAKQVAKLTKTEITEEYEEDGYSSIKVETKTVAKNKDAGLYLVDTTVNYRDWVGQKVEETYFALVRLNGKNVTIVREYEYHGNADKKDVRNVAIASLAKG